MKAIRKQKTQVMYGIMGSLLLDFAEGMSYLVQALIMLAIVLCIFYIVYLDLFEIIVYFFVLALKYKQYHADKMRD